MKTYLAAAALATIVIAAPAQAQSFTYEVTWGEINMIGGVGPDNSMSAAVFDGTYVVTYADGRTATGEMNCAGMDQPDNSLFDLHMSCDSGNETGMAAITYACNWRGEPGTSRPLACVGYLEGQSGAIEGRSGLLTLDWYERALSRGTGQWFE